jgi:hypothetical protein
LAALSVSGLLWLAEVFASQGSETTQYWSAILSLANWVGNVILPVYGGIEIVRAVLGVRGFFERLNIGDDGIRHFHRRRCMPLCFWVDELDGTLHRGRYKRVA